MLQPDSLTLNVDSCLKGCKGWSEGNYCHCKFPSEIFSIEGLATNELECLVLMQCDNLSMVQVVA